MAVNDPRPRAISGGELCPKCDEPMQRYEHSRHWRPNPDRGHYRYWDRCEPCRHFQHYHAAYVPRATPKTPTSLFDLPSYKDQENLVFSASDGRAAAKQSV